MTVQNIKIKFLTVFSQTDTSYVLQWRSTYADMVYLCFKSRPVHEGETKGLLIIIGLVAVWCDEIIIICEKHLIYDILKVRRSYHCSSSVITGARVGTG